MANSSSHDEGGGDRYSAAMRQPASEGPTPPANRDRTARGSYVLQGQSVIAPALAGGLYLVATPIGNLRDITVRALEVLASADLIACEDTRVTGKLLKHYGINTPLTPYHDHNAAEARPKLIARLATDGTVALVSDAGTPFGVGSGLQAGARSTGRGPQRYANPRGIRGARRPHGCGTAD